MLALALQLTVSHWEEKEVIVEDQSSRDRSVSTGSPVNTAARTAKRRSRNANIA